MTGFADTAADKLRGILADVSSSTDAVVARDDAKETVEQLFSTHLAFSLAESTAAAAKTSLRIPVPGNTNWVVRNAQLVIESGALAAAGYTNYLGVAVSKMADGAATAKTTIASWNTQTDSLALGAIKSMTVSGANKLVQGGSIVVDLTKTGTGQTSGVANVLLELRRVSD